MSVEQTFLTTAFLASISLTLLCVSLFHPTKETNFFAGMILMLTAVSSGYTAGLAYPLERLVIAGITVHLSSMAVGMLFLPFLAIFQFFRAVELSKPLS